VPLELFLTTYPMLMCVTVSDDPADWRVTDQGLCIVRWGLRGPRHRPLLQWSAQELQALQRRVIAASGMPDVAPGEASYSRVARSAWKVIKDDDEQQRMQKVGDRAKETGVNTQVASGTPDPNSPMPVPRRASWLAWAETGLVVLALAAAGAGWWMDHWSLSETRDNLNKELLARKDDLREAKAGRETAETAKESLQSQLTACRADGEAAGPSLAEARLNAQLAVRRASALEGRLTDLESLKNQLEKEKDGALVESERLEIELANLKKQLTAAQTRGERAVDQTAPVSGDPTAPVTPSANGSAPKPGTPPVPAQVDPLPAPSKDSHVDLTVKGSGGPEAGEVQSSGDENNLQSALKQLANLYKKPPSNLPDNRSSEVADVAKHLGGEAGLALQRRLQGTYVNEVQARSSGSKRAQDLHQTTATIPSGMLDVLKRQNQVFTDQNALIRIGPNPNDFEGVTCPDQKWYWVKLSDCFAVFVAASKDNPLDAKSVGKVVNLQVLPFKVSGFVVYRGVVGSQPKELWRWSSTGPQGFDVPQKVPPPFEIYGKGQTIEDLAKVLQAFADRVMIKDLNEVGKSESKSVPIPADVAWVCAKDVLTEFLLLTSLSDPVENGVDKDVKDWCLRLLKALEPGTDGEQPIPRFRMRDFKKLVDHPPFFLPGSQLSTLTLFGVLSVSGDNAKIIKPTGGVSVRAGHLAVLDGSVLRHIGYLLKDGEPVFDAPAELESLLGCAVFVVESKQKPSPSK
jgi:hypothetical protein